MSWSSNQYVRFEDERTRAARDLLAAVPASDVRRAVDLGCGPGNSTELLARRYAGASILGIDSSEDMVAAARRRLPNVAFSVAAIDAWCTTEAYDLIFANASLHWVPDHAVVLPRLAEALTIGGSLAIQMPDNLSEPSHVRMRKIAADSRWSAKMAQALSARTVIEAVSWYYDVLRPVCDRVDIWRTTYHHVMDGVGAITEWFKGSALRPYLAALEANERDAYLAEYTEALKGDYPVRNDGKVLLRFPRLFIVATR